MNPPNHDESRLWRLLEEKGLADLSQFHRRGFFDEIPLYTRRSEVDFLPSDEGEANAILLRFALKFLRAVVAYEPHRTGYFAAVTIWGFADVRLVPNLFVWCDGPRMSATMPVLKSVRTPFGKQIKKLIPRRNPGDSFEVLEETSTVPDAVRVFVAPAEPPYPGFVTLERFRGPARASK